MTQKHNNILLEYKQTEFMYRITKIRNKNIVELDEIFSDPNLARKFFDALVSNVEFNEGFSSTISASKKNKIQGYPAIAVATFGNLGIEVGLSIRPIVDQFKNLREFAEWETTEGEYIIATAEDKPKGFMEKLKSLIR